MSMQDDIRNVKEAIKEARKNGEHGIAEELKRLAYSMGIGTK